jgi:uncharacterized protein (DUF58 family)
MRPGPLLVRAVLALAAASLLVPLFPPLVFALAAALLVLAGAAFAEALQLKRIAFSVQRPDVQALPLGEPDSLQLVLRSNAARELEVTVRQSWPALIDALSARRTGVLRPGESLPLELPVRGLSRGRAALPAPHVLVRLSGLVERIAEAGAPAELIVLPNLRAVAAMHTKLNQFILKGLGNRTSARLGKGREFDRLREYVRGDEVRDIAWKASARRGKLIVREYRLDRSQDVLVCLDAGHRMEARVAGLSKLDHAVNASVLLAYICNRMEDRSSLLWFATDVHVALAPGRGSGHLVRFTELAASAAGAYVHSDYLALAAQLRRRLKHRTLIAILTALPETEHEPLLRALRLLAPQHLPLLLVLQDPELLAAACLLPADKAELSRMLAARDIVSKREQAVREARSLGALVVETTPADAGVAAMNAYVDVKRRQLL